VGECSGDTLFIRRLVHAERLKQLQFAVAGDCGGVVRLVGTFHTHPYRADSAGRAVKERGLSAMDLRRSRAAADIVTMVMWDLDSLDAATKAATQRCATRSVSPSANRRTHPPVLPGFTARSILSRRRVPPNPDEDYRMAGLLAKERIIAGPGSTAGRTPIPRWTGGSPALPRNEGQPVEPWAGDDPVPWPAAQPCGSPRLDWVERGDARVWTAP